MPPREERMTCDEIAVIEQAEAVAEKLSSHRNPRCVMKLKAMVEKMHAEAD